MKILSLYSPNIFIIQKELNLDQFLEAYDENQVLFIVTPSIQGHLSFSPKKGVLTSGYGLSKKNLDKKISELKDVSKIIAIGASKILDQAKYIASQLDVPLIAIPSALSTNAFSTGMSVVKINEKATSIESKVPDEVYIINSLLQTAPKEYNKFGLIDVLSIYTAVEDWNIAIADKQVTPSLEYYLAKGILKAFLSFESSLSDNYYNIAKLLLHSGLVVSMYGDGRPESGSEHIVAKAIESKIECFHAHSVSFGMLVILKLQESWREDVVNLAKNIPDWKSDYGKDILSQIRNNLSSDDIKPRSGRYTVLDKVDNKKIEVAIEEALNFLENDIRM